MPYSPTTWVDGSTAVTAARLNNIESGLSRSSPALVTSLPGSPTDGQQCILVDSTSNPAYHWLLQYVAAKASNKWICIGGTRKEQSLTDSTISSATEAQYGTESFTVPVAGQYICTVMNHFYGSVVGGSSVYYTGPAKNGVIVDPASLFFGDLASTSAHATLTSTLLITGWVASDVLTVRKGRTAGTGTCGIDRGYFAVIPFAVGG